MKVMDAIRKTLLDAGADPDSIQVKKGDQNVEYERLDQISFKLDERMYDNKIGIVRNHGGVSK